MEHYDVIVVGAGAAGLHIAGLLAEQATVCLIESKADPTCVSFHTLGSFIERKRYGLSEKIIAATISECVFHSKHITAIKHVPSFILNKTQIHRELFERAKAKNVTVKLKTRIVRVLQNATGAVEMVTDREGGQYHAKIFIDATGVAGLFSRQLGLQDTKMNIATGLEYDVLYHGSATQAHLYIGKAFLNGYGWIFPMGNGRAIVGYGAIRPQNIPNKEMALNTILKLESMRPLITKDNDRLYGGIVPITEIKTTFVYKNVLCVGDAVSQVHPLVGEGYRFVLEAGKIAAPYIVEALKTGDLSKLLAYERTWKKVFYESYRKGKYGQWIADMASRSDMASDLLVLFINMLTSRRVARGLSGGV